MSFTGHELQGEERGSAPRSPLQIRLPCLGTRSLLWGSMASTCSGVRGRNQVKQCTALTLTPSFGHRSTQKGCATPLCDLGTLGPDAYAHNMLQVGTVLLLCFYSQTSGQNCKLGWRLACGLLSQGVKISIPGSGGVSCLSEGETTGGWLCMLTCL